MSVDLIQSWNDLDPWIQELAGEEIRAGALPPSMAVSFVGDRPDVIVETPTFVAEEADAITDQLINLFGVLRPERLAVCWPNRFEDPQNGDVYFAVRLHTAWQTGPSVWKWCTRVLPYVHHADTGEVEWGPPFELENPPDPQSRRLRRLYRPATHHRLLARGWLELPEDDRWFVATHPDSRTFDELQSLPGVGGSNSTSAFLPGFN